MVKIYSPLLVGTITKKPQNTHLDIQLVSGNKIFVDSADNTKIYHLNTTTLVETQLDVDPSNTSGDNKSRDHKVQSLWHDRDNQIIWAIDCDNNGVQDNFDVWKFDYSASETAPTVTEIATWTDPNNDALYLYDVWVYDANTYALGWADRDSGSGGPSVMEVWDVDSNPIVSKDTAAVAGGVETMGYVVIEGDNAYFNVEDKTNNDVTSFWYDHSATNLEWTGGGGDSPLDGYTLPHNRDQLSIAYHNGILWMVLLKDADSKTYLFTFDTDTDDFTELAEMNIALMLDRNTDSSNEPECFALEKGFGVTVATNSLYVYQIPRSYQGRLNWIASLKAMYEARGYPNAYIVSVTDTYLIIDATDDGGSLELQQFSDMANYVSRCEITADKEDWWDCKFQHRREFTYNSVVHIWELLKNMTFQVYDTYTAALQIFKDMGVSAFFQGSGGLNDEDVGAIATADDNEWIDTLILPNACTCEIIAELDDHKNVLKLTHDGGADDPYLYHTITASVTGTFETYIASSDVTVLNQRLLLQESTNHRIIIEIGGSKIYHYPNNVQTDTGVVPVNDTLNHIKIEFSCTTDTYDLYIDTVLIGGGGSAFTSAATSIDGIYIKVFVAAVHSFYLDAPGLVGEQDPAGFTYYEHRNLVAYRTDFLIFEGLVRDYDKLRLETVLIESQAREIDSVEPSGEYSGRTDEIIVDINATTTVSYITDGTLSEGHAMGTITFKGNKTYYRVLHNFKDQDKFTFYFSAIGKLYYDDATVGNNVYLRRDATYKDKIRNVTPSHPSKEVNQVTVTGAIDPTDGLPYEGTYNDEASQQATGEIIQLLIRDATLNSDALCLDKATNILTRDSANPTVVRFAYYKKELGFMNPGHVITFKYDTTLVSISEASYIIDRIVYEAKKGTMFIEVSSGLIFQYDLPSEMLPEENSQLIEQVTYDIATYAPRIYEFAVDPNPAVDDITLGYKRGDIWVNTTDDGAFICRNPADGAADWKEI